MVERLPWWTEFSTIFLRTARNLKAINNLENKHIWSLNLAAKSRPYTV
jgi:hypothetical protein